MNIVCLWPVLLPNQCCVKFPCEQCDYITTQPAFFAHSPSPQSAYSTILAQTRTSDRLSLVVTMPTPSVGFCQSGLRRVESIFWASGEHWVYCPGHWPAGSLPCVCCPPLISNKLGGERREPGLATVTRGDTAAWVRPPVSADFWLFCHEMATIIHCQAITPDITHHWCQAARG